MQAIKGGNFFEWMKKLPQICNTEQITMTHPPAMKMKSFGLLETL